MLALKFGLRSLLESFSQGTNGSVCPNDRPGHISLSDCR